MNLILKPLETLVNENCLTLAEALTKAYLAGHRAAVKKLQPAKPELIVDNVQAASTGE